MRADDEFHTPAFEVNVIDTTGAGDVFHGAYLAGLVKGWDLKRIATFASAVAAIHCTVLGNRKGIPSMFGGAFYLDLGGLASYAPGFYASGKQAARLVEKIMRGESPAQIPVEVNNDIEFAVNLKAAKALGLKIPPEVLYRANRIIR